MEISDSTHFKISELPGGVSYAMLQTRKKPVGKTKREKRKKRREQQPSNFKLSSYCTSIIIRLVFTPAGQAVKIPSK